MNNLDRIMSSLLQKIIRKTYPGLLLNPKSWNSRAVKLVEEELRKYKFTVGGITCVRTNTLLFDPYLGRMLVRYKCSGINTRVKNIVMIDSSREEEVIEKVKEFGNKDKNKRMAIWLLMGYDTRVSIPRIDVFRRLWEGGALVEAVVRMNKLDVRSKVRAVWGFAQTGFVNTTMPMTESFTKPSAVPMLTVVGGKLAVYNAMPTMWGNCIPIEGKVTRGPDKGERVAMCLPGLMAATQKVRYEMNLVSIIKSARKVSKENELLRELREVMLREVLPLVIEQSQVPDTQGS